MPTIVDALVVTLGLDAKKFQEGQADVRTTLQGIEKQATRSASEIERRGNQAAEFFTSMKRAAIGLGATLAGLGIERFVRDVARMGANVQALSHTLDVSAADLGAWQRAVVHIANGTAEGVTSSMQAISNDLQNATLTGQSQMIPFFRQLGIAVTDVKGKIRPVTDLLIDLAARFQGMDPAKAAVYGRHLGLDQGMINLLMKGPAAIQAEIAQQKAQSPNEDTADRSLERLNQAAIGLEQHFQALGKALVVKLEPVLLRVANFLEEVMNLWDGKLSWTDFKRRHELGDQQPKPEKPGRYDNEGTLEWNKKHPDQPLKFYFRTLEDIDAWNKKHPEAVQPRTPDFNIFRPETWFQHSNANEPIAAPGSNIGMRNNNPLNLKYYPGQNAVSDGTYGRYATMEEGVKAAWNQLKIYQDRYGLNTLSGIINRWAPPSENDTVDYIGHVSKWTGIKANDRIDIHDPNIAAAVIHAMARMEVGGIDRGTVARGVGLADRGQAQSAGASRAAAAVRQLSSLSAAGGASIRNEVHIAQITVNTAATDARGIASAIGGAVRRNMLSTQANTGLA